ncbi:hypothetical protein RhiXN_04430 [Rhizoctonia solani]|uniref:Uncharacterized protein n=1 Tax=Rhizoctonia solani TaxID=456999 RepID=A0A8H8NMH9_9AGAM|nr:uncharacterized protein RhiXN_04430 [Rhizoctonia solani]QRW16429.1 hypothetical protein RhiXN_04430 [Rhizoctonia solani]
MWGRAGAYCDGPNVHLIALQLAHHCTMPMYADLLEAGKSPALDFVLPYDQPEVRKDPEERLNEIEQLAEDLYGDGEKAPSTSCEYTRWKNMQPVLQGRLGKSLNRAFGLAKTGVGHGRGRLMSVDLDDDKLRPDALLLHGEPISKLSTEKIFEYVATYCDSPPTSLEWIDDRTTVIVFESPTAAKSAFPNLATRSADEPEPESQPKRSSLLILFLKDVAARSAVWIGSSRARESVRSRPGGAGGDDLDAELDEMKRRREAGDEEWEAERTAALDRELDALAARKDGDEENMEVESASRLQSRLGPRKNVSRPIASLPRRRGQGRAPKERPKQTQEDLDAD